MNRSAQRRKQARVTSVLAASLLVGLALAITACSRSPISLPRQERIVANPTALVRPTPEPTFAPQSQSPSTLFPQIATPSPTPTGAPNGSKNATPVFPIATPALPGGIGPTATPTQGTPNVGPLPTPGGGGTQLPGQGGSEGGTPVPTPTPLASGGVPPIGGGGEGDPEGGEEPEASPTPEGAFFPSPTPTPTLIPTPTPFGSGGGGGGLPPPPGGGEATPTPTPEGGSGDPEVEPLPPELLTPTSTPWATPGPSPTPVPEIVLAEVVDIILLPSAITVGPGETFTIDIQVEPNEQAITVVRVVLTFNSAHIQAVSTALNPESPLTTQLLPSNYFSNSLGVVALSAGPQPELEATVFETPFIMGSVTFRALNVNTTTSIGFIELGAFQTRADVEGAIVTGDLTGSIVTIQTEPTPTPTPTP